MKEHRIISLLPSCTEIVCALGLENQLVGRSHECDFPESIRHLPVCTEPKLDVQATSAEIDRKVKDLLRNALSLYRIDVEKLKSLRPDVILTQAQCEVCAVSLPAVEAAVGAWLGARPQIISLAPQALRDIWEDIRRVAEALGVPERGQTLLKTLKGRVVDIIEKACVVKRRPSVACIEWIEPLMAAGNWVPELVDLAGGLNLFGEAGKHSPWLNWEAVREHDPEIIIILPCGFDLARTRKEMTPRCEKRARVPGGRQPIFQSSRTAPGRVAGNSGGNYSARHFSIRSQDQGLGTLLSRRNAVGARTGFTACSG